MVVGRLIFDAMMMRDYPVLQGAFVIISISVIIANYIADLLYGFLDPRIKYA
ncbi:MAG: ABC transporter permease subunit [archaeon GB-1867-005]|nr:ABC transporter permease subunit [Candidatus Culexmicrobium cathedralense]